jgi:hypothetical protein
MARGIYHDTAARSGDYVIHPRRGGGFVVDRVGSGGTHTTIGPVRGVAHRHEANEIIRRDAHYLGRRAGSVFLQREDDMILDGSVADIAKREKESVPVDPKLKKRMDRVLGKDYTKS